MSGSAVLNAWEVNSCQTLESSFVLICVKTSLAAFLIYCYWVFTLLYMLAIPLPNGAPEGTWFYFPLCVLAAQCSGYSTSAFGQQTLPSLTCLSQSMCIVEECWICHLSSMPSNEKVWVYCLHQFPKTCILKSSRGNQCRSLAFKAQFMHFWAIRLAFISLYFRRTVGWLVTFHPL